MLELGTGTGHGTAWLLSGMDAGSTLERSTPIPTSLPWRSVIWRADERVTFHVMDGAAFLEGGTSLQFDLIYADAWPGKFTHLNEALSLLRPGGFYLIETCCRSPTGLRDTHLRCRRWSTTSNDVANSLRSGSPGRPG